VSAAGDGGLWASPCWPLRNKQGPPGASCRAAAILATVHLPPWAQKIVPVVLRSFSDPDSRVRYYACEALYNIAKVRLAARAQGCAVLWRRQLMLPCGLVPCRPLVPRREGRGGHDSGCTGLGWRVQVTRGDFILFFNYVFDALCKMSADPDTNVQSAAHLLDRLVQVGAPAAPAPIPAMPRPALDLAVQPRRAVLEPDTPHASLWVPVLSLCYRTQDVVTGSDQFRCGLCPGPATAATSFGAFGCCLGISHWAQGPLWALAWGWSARAAWSPVGRSCFISRLGPFVGCQRGGAPFHCCASA